MTALFRGALVGLLNEDAVGWGFHDSMLSADAVPTQLAKAVFRFKSFSTTPHQACRHRRWSRLARAQALEVPSSQF
jgi:hypothetical protein